jgi:thymidylate synthase
VNYLEIIKNVVNNGVAKQATRYDAAGNVIPVENGTIGTFCEIFRHDMSTGFPLTTLRKMPWKSIRVELEGFIKGVTDKSWYKERGCNFWNEWANPIVTENSLNLTVPNDLLFTEKEKEVFRSFNNRQDDSYFEGKMPKKWWQEQQDDLGPIYGYQWVSFGQTYDYGQSFNDLCSDETGLPDGFNQLKSIVDKLKTSPYDRRMVCSAWNPNQMHMMALPSCHVLHQVVVYGNKLNLTWFQRSCDSTHGLPNNIASYALLLMLYCEESGLEPGELVGVLSDCHVYENTIESAKELISREENKLPNIKIKRKEDGSFSIFDWTWSDVELIDYNPHPPIDMGKVTV